MPSGLRFLRQFSEYGLKSKIPVLGNPTCVDEGVLKNMGDEALGVVTASWYTATMESAPERGPLHNDLDVDVCVIGAGLAGLGGALGVSLLTAPTRRLRPQQVDRTAVALGQQVGAERASVGIELLGLVPEAQEDLLHDLLGHRGVGQQAPSQPEHRTGMASVGLGQREQPAQHAGEHALCLPKLLHRRQIRQEEPRQSGWRPRRPAHTPGHITKNGL